MLHPSKDPPSPDRSGTDPAPYRLQLFVAGNSARSGRAVENLRRLGAEALAGRYDLEIIDVLRDPDRAEAARVLTTPTVIRIHPLPERRVTGDLSRPADVLAALAPPDAALLPRPHGNGSGAEPRREGP